jgi:hypothetical protein
MKIVCPLPLSNKKKKKKKVGVRAGTRGQDNARKDSSFDAIEERSSILETTALQQ